MNLAVGRMGSVLNDLVSPFIAFHWNLSLAIWFGTFMCLISFICGYWLVRIDKMKLNSSQEELELPSISNSHETVSFLQDSIQPLQDPIDSDESNNLNDPMDPMDPNESNKDSNTTEFKIKKNIFQQIPSLYWILCALMCFYYAADIPFNAIHAAFLQSRWYKKDPQTASQIMGIPDTLSALFVPFIGIFVDKYGHRSLLLCLCGVIMMSVHIFFLYSTALSPSPIPALIFLGFAYALLSIIWPCIPLLVPKDLIATAFGIGTCLLNLTFAITPLIVAFLMDLDVFFLHVESFFVLCCLVGLILSIILYISDSQKRLFTTKYSSLLST